MKTVIQVLFCVCMLPTLLFVWFSLYVGKAICELFDEADKRGIKFFPPLLGVAVLALANSTAHAGGYGHSYCSSCYYPQKVVQQPYNVTNVGNLNQFYTPAPYAQQYPITDAGYTAARAEQMEYQAQVLIDQVQALRNESRQRLVLVVPQVQAYAVQTETTTETQHCVPGDHVPNSPGNQGPFSLKAPNKVGLITACANCHGEGKKAQKHFDMSQALDCDQQKAAILAVVTGQMPKGKRVQLTPEELSSFMDELGAWKANEEPPQQPTPPQDQPEPEGENAAPTEQPFSRIMLPPSSAAKLAKQR